MNNIHEKYNGYTVDDLLQDSCFIRSVQQPDQENMIFHKQLVEEGILSREELDQAVFLINSLRTHSEPVRKGELELLWEDIEISNKKNLRKRRRFIGINLSAVAGIAASLLMVFYVYRPVSEESVAILNIEDVEAPVMNGEDIQLILADNEMLSLEGKEADIAYNKEGLAINNEEIELHEKTRSTQQEMVYNQLIVPLGKRSMLTLSEGTKIWVNAGTRVVYPVTFAADKREIFVDGEAFLEVQRNEDHPFIVKTQTLSVKVLGTSFNVMAYGNDTIQSVVLVQGAVTVSTSEKAERLLKPNEMYAYYNGTSEVRTVDVKDYVLWTSGAYKYKSESLGNILKRLSRYYGKEIHYTNEVARIKCSGTLELTDDLNDVLDGISLTAPITIGKESDKYSIQRKQI